MDSQNNAPTDLPELAESSESLLSFPCAFPIKIIGDNIESLSHAVQEVINQYVDAEDQLSVNHNLSRNEKFISITVNIQARSQSQLDAIYQALSKLPQVNMVL